MKGLLAIWSAYSITEFLNKVKANYWSYVMTVVSTGMFISVHSFLPSTFTMNFFCMTISAFIDYQKG